MNYSYDELVKLENEAIKRARRINDSERDAVRQMNRSIKPGGTPAPEQRKKESPPKTHGGALSEDSMLILALLLVLSREKTDTLLLMALMYILL